MRTIRTAIAGIAVAGLAISLGPAAPGVAQTDADTVRVLHITVDSLHPDEVGAATPTLSALRDAGTWYTQARAIMAAETLPNHIAMGTGTYAGRHGIPGNDGLAAPGDTEGADPDLGIYGLRDAYSTFEAIEAQCPDLQTVGVLSKEYVWRTFSEDPVDVMFDQPTFNIPGSGHAPEAATVPAILEQLRSDPPPDFLFANLGDVDRAGHVDPTGIGPVAGGRQGALENTDALLGSIVQTLQQEGLWESTVLVISSDHSMDFSNPVDPTTRVDVASALEADGATAGRFLVSENGGAGFVFLLDPGDDADATLVAARSIIAGLDGVAEVLYREPNPADPAQDLATVHPDWNLHQTFRAGDLFVHATDGHVIGSQSSNPLPGNHGHGVTRHAVALIAGGWDGIVAQTVEASDPDAIDVVDDTASLAEQAEQVDYAPTFGWLLGVEDPAITIDGAADGQWQGRVLSEAFSRQPVPVCAAGTAPEPEPTTSTTATTATTTSPPTAPPPEALPATGGRSAGPLALVLAAGALVVAGLARRRVTAAG